MAISLFVIWTPVDETKRQAMRLNPFYHQVDTLANFICLTLSYSRDTLISEVQTMRNESARKVQAGTVTAVRLDDRLRYLTEIAAATKGMTLTEYISWALAVSFEQVSLHVATEPEIVYEDFSKPPTVIAPDPVEERSQWEAKLISARANDLWSENRFMRLWSQVILAPHTLNEDKKSFFDYIKTRNDLWIPAKPLPGMKGTPKGLQPDRERIDREYDEIWKAFEKQREQKVRKK